MKAAVVGLGTMGPGIAATLARGGLDVVCFDVSSEQSVRARASFPDLKLEQDLGRAVSAAELVIEAVPEKLEIKQGVFKDLERLAGPEAILASNTSGIPITKLQEAVQKKGRVVGMHWSNPPHIIPVVELIAGAHTERAVVQQAKALAEQCGLIPVVVEKDIPGFVHNRLLYAVLREAVSLVEKGVVSPEELDKCFKWALGLKLSVIGPMELLDVAGLDIYEAVAAYLNAELDASRGVPRYIRERTAQGMLGMKTGKGIYDYTPESAERLRAERGAKLLAVRRALEGR
jgi:3-hydroxybutyryl-CoA dehydrogenase/5-formyl-3-hydroxy-2-methylpyridine 4-carboxylate dehydrogenase